MADQLQIRRGTTAQNNGFTGAQGELTADTDLKALRLHDGITPGGFALASQTQVFNGTFYFNDNTGGGSAANAYILVPKSNTLSPTQYLDGVQFGFTTANANTGPSTATFNGLGVKSLKYRGGIDPAAGDINGRVYLIYDAASDWFEIQRKATGPAPQLRTLAGSVASSALTAGMVPQVVDFRGTPVTSGNPTSINVTSTISITAPSGATLGTTSGVLNRIVVLALNNAGTVVLGLTNANNNTLSFDETDLVATTAIGAASTSANVVYSTASLSNVPYRVIGYIESTQATAGVWSTSPSKIAGQGGQNNIGPAGYKIVSSPSQATTSGTSVDFTGIPSWAKRITINLNGVSVNAASVIMAQIGTSSGVEVVGYAGSASGVTNAVATTAYTTGFGTLNGGGAGPSAVISGSMVLVLAPNNTWCYSGVLTRTDIAETCLGSGIKTLAGVLDRVRLTTVTGTDVFDLGSANIVYEG